jgi:predicted Zn-dependent peptidase
MDVENNNNKENLKEIKTLLKQETLKRKKLEEKLKITFEELTNSNKDNLMALETQISQIQEAYNRTEFYKDLFAHDINNILQSLFSGIQVCEITLSLTISTIFYRVYSRAFKFVRLHLIIRVK